MNTLYTYGKLFHEGGGAFNNAKAGQNAEPVVTPKHSEGQAGIAKTKFTPGPWEKDYGQTRGHIKAVIEPGKYTPTVARYDLPMMDQGEQEANANLIASAPELYAALVKLAEEVRVLAFPLGTEGYDPLTLSLNAADLAISKALGNSSVNKEGEE